MLPVCTTLSKTTSHRSLVWPGCVRKLKLVRSGLDDGKFLIVQLPSIWICEGGLGVTKPSTTPPRSATQRSACAGVAVSSDTAQVNSRIAIHLWPILTRIVLLEVMYALVPITK